MANDAGISQVQKCLFHGQSACGLDELSHCSFCTQVQPTSEVSQKLDRVEPFDDKGLPWASEDGL